MTAEIHRLGPCSPIIEPQPEIVERLRQLLDKAERGEVKGIAYTYVNGADEVLVSWVSGSAGQNGMLAGTTMLGRRLAKAVDGEG